MLMNNFFACLTCGRHQNTWYDGSIFSGDSYIAFKQGTSLIIKYEPGELVEGMINKH